MGQGGAQFKDRQNSVSPMSPNCCRRCRIRIRIFQKKYLVGWVRDEAMGVIATVPMGDHHAAHDDEGRG